jgi:tetratricopeptide (TPR) repeat protein
LVTATNRPDPSFAVTAIHLLQSNSILEAAQLCASGVEHYPDYIGGYVLLASAYESLGQHHDAQVIREALHTRFPGLPLLKSYIQAQQESLVEDTPDIEEPQTFDEDQVPEVEQIAESVSVLEVEPATESEVVCFEEPAIEPVAEFSEDFIIEAESEVHVELAIEPEPETFEGPSPVTSHPNVLRLIEMAPITTDTRIIRSSSVRLIPGLEFTSLRFEGTRSRGRREITSLLDPPAFRTFHPIRRTARPSETQEPRKKPVTLEELAARLNDARLPRNTGGNDQEISREDFSAMQSPIMITETIARIYMQQGSFELAIEAFKALQKQKPEKTVEFEKLIKECERKRA